MMMQRLPAGNQRRGAAAMKAALLRRRSGRRCASCLAESSAASGSAGVHPQRSPLRHDADPWPRERARPTSRRETMWSGSRPDRGGGGALLRRLFHASSSAESSSSSKISIENTPLDGPDGAALLRGLEVHTVPSEDDGHPLAVYTAEEDDESDGDEAEMSRRTPVLLLHGRTWSSVPVYHLQGRGAEGGTGGNEAEDEIEDRSLIRALRATGRIEPYGLDFRGFGGTPKDASGVAEPLRCVADAVSALNWIRGRHDLGGAEGGSPGPALLGWSHGALIAQIVAQRHAGALSKLILYGSLYNPNIKYAIPPPPGENNPNRGHTDHDFDDFPLREMASRNELDGAMEDFTNASSGVGGWDDEARLRFPPASAKLFANAALTSDPIKAQWCNLHQLNECHPSLVRVPTMVIAGDQDPYAPPQAQAELFTNLGRGVDRTWSVIADADHAVHLSNKRRRFVERVTDFLVSRS